MEIWKSIENYPNYQISSLGNVRTVPHFAGTRNYGGLKKLNHSHNGYLRVTLFNSEGRKIFFVHCLVAQAFVPNPNHTINTQVNHINELKNDNRASNLEWCSPQYNSSYGKRPEKISHYQKYVSHRRKTVYQYLNGKLINTFMSAKEASRQLNMSQGHISACCRGEKPLYKGYKFSYTPIQ